jgi:hypothetical protein
MVDIKTASSNQCLRLAAVDGNFNGGGMCEFIILRFNWHFRYRGLCGMRRAAIIGQATLHTLGAAGF